MTASKKILWVVRYESASDFLQQAKAAKVTGVAIRTDNDIKKALPMFHDEGLALFGWRWPSAERDAAMREADRAADLLGRGMDGYYVDPEGEPGKPWDWDRSGLEKLASDFCARVSEAGGDKPFGVTSHHRAKLVHPNLPWDAFFERATVLLPQSYWRVEGGAVGKGDPAENYRRGIAEWVKAGGDRDRIVPMAGEIAFAKPTEIAAYAAEAAAHKIKELHYYTALPAVTPAVLAAMAAT